MAACGIAPEDDDGNAATKAKGVELVESRKSIAQDHFDKMDEEEQAFLREQAQSIKDWFGSSEQGGFDAYREVTEKMDSEEKIALWSLVRPTSEPLSRNKARRKLHESDTLAMSGANKP